MTQRPCYILGISAYYHDSAAALICDGKILAAAQEERFTRKKHDARFPREAATYCLQEAGISLRDVHAVVFYDKPFLKFERLIETYFSFAPRGFASFVLAMPVWIKEKLFLKSTLKAELAKLNGGNNKTLPLLWFTEHHQSHAASAFFPSPFESAAVMCLDGVGEWATASVWRGNGNKLEPLWELRFPHSLGLLYSAFTYYTGFKVNSGEYKLMGLAPYGEPKYVDLILKNLIDIKSDGTFRLNLEYFDFMTGLRMTGKKFHALFGGPPRKPESPVTQKEMDIARSIQVVTEEVVLRLAKAVHRETGEKNLCLAGGVALNCVANGRLLREGPFEELWIQPAAGDAGGALGAAFSGWHQFMDRARKVDGKNDLMDGTYLGPKFPSSEVAARLKKLGAEFVELPADELDERLAEILANENVVGWFSGRMEFGPRALGSRSIIGDPRNPKMQSVMNLKIKYRESFRPFAPAVLAEDASEYFKLERPSPYMLIVAPVEEKHQLQTTGEQKNLFGIEKLNVARSTIPAVTHVDYSARIQTVHRETNSRFYNLLKKFKEQTGTSVLVNTSFNVRGEPIVCTPEDAFRCFMRTEMDYLIIENCLLTKSAQPATLKEDKRWQKEFALD